jgi:hypothetical protein
MALPNVGATIDFSNGAAFISTAFTLDSATRGKLGTGQLADANTVVDLTTILLKVSTRRGRSRLLSKFEAGTATVELKDENGYFNPENTASPYYGNLVPLRKIQIWADWDGVRYYLFSGFITSYINSFVQGVDTVNKVTIQASDAFKLFEGVTVTTVTGSAAGDYSGTRVTQILDQIAFPSSLRNINTGDSTMQTNPTDARSALEAFRQVEDSELGGFYIAGNGNATFLSRTNVSEFADNAPLAFSDDGTALPYVNVKTALDDGTLYNSVSVTRIGGSAQVVQDTTSIDKYFIHSGQRTNMLVQTDTEALNMAKMLLASRKDTELRVDEMTVNLADDTANLQSSVLGMELLDYLRVTKHLSGSSEIVRDVLAYGISHDINQASFTTTIYTGEPIVQAFLLDSTTQGIIGTNVLSY